MIEQVIDLLIHSAAPADKNSVSSVNPKLIVLMVAPMILLTKLDDPLQIRTTILLILNIAVRLIYPSCYYPASASVEGYIAFPLTARSIAFVAEFSMYELWAVWVDVDFWGASKVWVLVFFGESISTIALLLQSELLFNLEDSTWALHAVYMASLSYPKYAWAVMFFSAFSLHMLLYHLPSRFKLMFSRLYHCGKSAIDIFKLDPLYCREYFPRVMLKEKSLCKPRRIKKVDDEEKAWVVPMLIG